VGLPLARYPDRSAFGEGRASAHQATSRLLVTAGVAVPAGSVDHLPPYAASGLCLMIALHVAREPSCASLESLQPAL
jgi:hypothetical protein